MFDLFANKGPTGEYKKITGIEVSKALKTAGQNFSTSTQVRWGQSGSYQASNPQSINGFTFDDIRFYQPVNDIQIKELASPQVSNCGMSNQEPIMISVYNSMKYPLTNVRVFYQVNNGSSISALIPSVPAQTTIHHTFSQLANLSGYQTYTIRTWVSVTGDTDTNNNEIVTEITNGPVISAFPYLETFESGTGNWFAGGQLSTWEHGTPAATRISRAASGTKAWKTKLAGNHNDREYSYLYSPCFRISQMTNPSLSFMMAIDIEDCGNVAPCDMAWVEYSHDGITWQQLGEAAEGTNWYNKSFGSRHGWSQVNYTNWHVASIDLPKPAPSTDGRIRLRFVFKSDIFRNREGIAIDDIHIYDKTYQIATTNESVTHPISSGSGSWSDFAPSNNVFAALNPAGGAAPGLTKAETYHVGGPTRYANNTYYHGRSYVIQPTNTTLHSATKLRLFFSDSEMETMLRANQCAGCLNATSVLSLGISKFSHTNKTLENGSITDNVYSGWTFLQPGTIAKIPFDKGYYLEFSPGSFSEFWLSPAPIFSSDPLPVTLTSFQAEAVEEKQVLLSWKVTEMSNFSHFEVQRANGNEAVKNGFFKTIASIPGEIKDNQVYQFVDQSYPDGVLYYRLKMVDLDGSFVYSDMRSVIIGTGEPMIVYPNPSLDGVFFLTYQQATPATVRVFDLMGKTIKTASIDSDGFPGKMPIDLRSFPSGVYLIEAVSADKREMFRVVIR